METEEVRFPSDETQQRLASDFAIAVRSMSIGFIKLSVHNGIEDGTPAGTGTLVRFGEVYGILTAAHVLSELPTGGAIGIVTFRNKVERTKINMAQTERCSIRADSYGPDGPDIGFLRLAREGTGWLEAISSFYNLKQSPDFLATIKAVPYFDALLGVVAEKTDDGPQDLARNMVMKRINALFCSGFVTGEHNVGGYDLLDFDPSFEDEAQRPTSFQGVSGGGLWRLHASEDRRRVLGVKLVGVAFYETSPVDGRRFLRCHGPATIYGPLVDCIRKKWGSDPGRDW